MNTMDWQRAAALRKALFGQHLLNQFTGVDEPEYFSKGESSNDEVKTLEDALNKSEDSANELEKGGPGSGRKAGMGGKAVKKVTVHSQMASHSSLHGKTFEVHGEREVQFASGKKKYYKIKDSEGKEHEIDEDFVKKSEDLTSEDPIEKAFQSVMGL